MTSLQTWEREKLNQLTGEVLDAAICVHKEMGPGLLESVYQACLVKELMLRGYLVESFVSIRLIYKGNVLDKEYVIDILVEGEVILELKSVEAVMPVHEAQIISYLKLANNRVGLLINFNVPLLINGFKRFVNHF